MEESFRTVESVSFERFVILNALVQKNGGTNHVKVFLHLECEMKIVWLYNIYETLVGGSSMFK